MSYHQVSSNSLTPSRPAPQAPQRRNDQVPLYSTSNALSSSGYNSSFTLNSSPSPSGSSYNNMSYSGIGATPNRGSDDTMGSQVIRAGNVSMKEDGFGNWLWQRKWLVLKEQILSFHKSEVCSTVFWFWFLLIEADIVGIAECTDAKYHLPARYHQHRADGSEALLSDTGDEPEALFPFPQERRGVVQLAR